MSWLNTKKLLFTEIFSYIHLQKSIGLASLNSCNPHDEIAVIQYGSVSGITIELVRGMNEYKFREESWESVESLDGGISAQNESLVVDCDTAIDVEIKDLAEHFPMEERISTASKNVHIVDEVILHAPIRPLQESMDLFAG